ncbi:hypothetical protein [Maribacter polysiphoniae]|uniref:hypothetical protein n=1 Tax=Maribacter polysiphoniae TaxID=429344 RepID=UPI0023545CEE|nr:hypothetical protein [Maribacter polysiphoniae]
MKSISNYIFIWVGLFLALQGCMENPKNEKSKLEPTTNVNTSGMVNILTRGMEFVSKDTLNSGWNTLTYKNESAEVHFILLDLYPAGKTVVDTENDILPPFAEGMKLIMDGDMDNAIQAFGKLPEWFQKVRYMGGTGLISPENTAKSTVYLEPGLYIMECYVKMMDGTWHTSHGMYKQIIVTEDKTLLQPPKATAQINISSTKGIVLKDSVSSGKQIFQVQFEDQMVYEHFLGHDINLVRYDDSAELPDLLEWLNWMNPKGLRSPAPKGFTFLGGMNNLPSGATGYFEANLAPGNYILVSEVPAADDKKLYYNFSVTH